MQGTGFEPLAIVPSWGTYIRGSEPPLCSRRYLDSTGINPQHYLRYSSRKESSFLSMLVLIARIPDAYFFAL